MADVEMKMPKMGESVAEATIIKWLKNEGDHIDADESVLEIATDKVDSEVPSSAEGILTKKLFNEGDVVKVGAVIAIISSGGTAAAASSAAKQQEAVAGGNSNSQPQETAAIAEKVPYVPAPSLAKSNGSVRFYSPLVRTIAAAESVTADELAAIEGTGAEARVTKRDILGYIERRTKVKSPPEIKVSISSSSATAPSP